MEVKNLNKYFSKKILRRGYDYFMMIKLKHFINQAMFMRHLLKEL